jgi:hypothetical protein
MKGIRRRMNTLSANFVCRRFIIGFHLLIVLAFFCEVAECQGDEMATEVSSPLQEFKLKRLDIEKKAEADTSRELQTLIRKLEKVSKGKNKNPKASEQATHLLQKIKSPTFLAVGLDELIEGTELGVSMKAAELIDAAYRQRRVTPEDWGLLPEDGIALTMKASQDTGIDVKPGDVVLVCPHPTQTWRKGPERQWTTFDGRFRAGDAGGPGHGMTGGDLRQELLAKVIGADNTEVIELKTSMILRCRIQGRLFLESRDRSDVGEGVITCKVYKMKPR